MELHKSQFLLGGLLIFGFICTGLSKPAPEENDYNMQSDDDYHYNDDDENVSPHHDKSTLVPVSTSPPYFETTATSVHVNPGEDAVLPCPVKNRAATNILMWYHDETLISQARTPIGVYKERFSISSNDSITIHNSTKADTGNYFCKVLPTDLKFHVKLHVSTEHNHPPEENSTLSLQGNDGKGSAEKMRLPSMLSILSVALVSLGLVRDILRI